MKRTCGVCGVRWAKGAQPCRRCQAARDGVAIRAPYRDWTMGELARLRELCASGTPLRTCAAMLGRTRRAISGTCRRHAIVWVPPPGQRARGELKRAVARLVRRGNNDAEIADALGVLRCVVWQARKRCGLPSAVNWSKVAKLRSEAIRACRESAAASEGGR